MKKLLFLISMTTFSVTFADESIDSLINAYMETTDLPSMTISISTKDQIIHKSAHGYRNLEDKLKTTTKTLYQVGSISKPFTSLLFGICCENGIINFDDKVVDFIPFFKLHNPILTQEITFRDFLSHQSGYSCHDSLWYNKRFSRKEMIDKLQHIPESFPFRKEFFYQNIGYMITAYGLECATNKSWEELASEYILIPLKMNDTCFDIKQMQQSNDFCFGYTQIDNKNTRTEFIDPYTIAPAGGICSNIEDLTKFTQLLLNKGGDLAYPETIEEIFSPQVITNFLANKEFGLDSFIQMEAYGLGFFVISYNGKKIVFHGGNIQGFSSLIALIPEDDIAVTILTNKNKTIAPFLLAISILEKYTSLEEQPWLETYKQFAEYENNSIIDEREKYLDNKQKHTAPSHPLKEYTGRYHHEGYGDCEIKLINEELIGRYNDGNMSLEHWHYNVFNASSNSEKYHFKNIKFHFLNNLHGDIAKLSVLFDPADGAIVFEKQAENFLFTEKYLEKYTGKYSYHGFGFVIELEDDHIVVKALGQPPFHLKPEKEHIFSVDNSSESYEGYIIQFLENEDSTIHCVQLIQPNGSVFSAYKSNP